MLLDKNQDNSVASLQFTAMRRVSNGFIELVV